jgi:hypothetical protein
LELSKNKQYHRLLKEVEARMPSFLSGIFIYPFLGKICGLAHSNLVVEMKWDGVVKMCS